MLVMMWKTRKPWALLVGTQRGAATIKKSENTNPKRYPHLHVHCSIIYNSPNMKAT